MKVVGRRGWHRASQLWPDRNINLGEPFSKRNCIQHDSHDRIFKVAIIREKSAGGLVPVCSAAITAADTTWAAKIPLLNSTLRSTVDVSTRPRAAIIASS